MPTPRGGLAVAVSVLIAVNAMIAAAPLANAENGGEPEQCQASWYGKVNGPPQGTASGEPLDPRALTGGHRTLPFGSHAKITNRYDVNRSVVVRINDRGPYTEGRCVNLTSGAFEKIAPLGAGVVPVTVEVLLEAPKPDTPKPEPR